MCCLNSVFEDVSKWPVKISCAFCNSNLIIFRAITDTKSSMLFNDPKFNTILVHILVFSQMKL